MNHLNNLVSLSSSLTVSPHLPSSLPGQQQQQQQQRRLSRMDDDSGLFDAPVDDVDIEMTEMGRPARPVGSRQQQQKGRWAILPQVSH